MRPCVFRIFCRHSLALAPPPQEPKKTRRRPAAANTGPAAATATNPGNLSQRSRTGERTAADGDGMLSSRSAGGGGATARSASGSVMTARSGYSDAPSSARSWASGGGESTARSASAAPQVAGGASAGGAVWNRSGPDGKTGDSAGVGFVVQFRICGHGSHAKASEWAAAARAVVNELELQVVSSLSLAPSCSRSLSPTISLPRTPSRFLPPPPTPPQKRGGATEKEIHRTDWLTARYVR